MYSDPGMWRVMGPAPQTQRDTEPNYRLLFEAAPGTYLVLTPDLRVVAVTDAYLAVTNTRRADLIGKHMFEAFPDNPDDPGASGQRNLAASFDRVLRQRAPDTMAVQKYDVRGSGGDGFEERYWSPVNAPILDERGEVAYIVHRVEDVTEFVRLRLAGPTTSDSQRALRRRADRMQAEILTRSTDLQETNEMLRQAADQLKQAEVMRGKFLAMTSHELRTPLTAIGGFTRTMIDMWDQLEDRRKIDFLQIIDRQVLRLSRLVQDLLLLAEVESGKLDNSPGPTQVSTVIHQTVQGLTQQAQIAVDCDDRLVVVSDPERLEQIIGNFITNACKYGEQPIEVHARESRDWVEIRVSDAGKGVPPEFVPELFTEFARQEEHRRDYDVTGTGLGLSIVRRLARAQGGDVFYEDAEPHGACFGVRLPIAH